MTSVRKRSAKSKSGNQFVANDSKSRSRVVVPAPTGTDVDASHTPKTKKRSHRGNTRNKKRQSADKTSVGTSIGDDSGVIESVPPKKMKKRRSKSNQPSSATASAFDDENDSQNKQAENRIPVVSSAHTVIGSSNDVGSTRNSKHKAGQPASLHDRLVAKLQGSRFRFINESLYSLSTADAQSMFEEDPDAFAIYHSGYSQQIAKWPATPLTGIISWLRNKSKDLIVADIGCGDALLAKSIGQKCHSFDLIALNDSVTVCNMDKVPLPDESVDVCVYCLSLMATNLADIFKEANRILKKGGLLKICEIQSRFYSVKIFIETLRGLGFELIKKKRVSEMFVVLELEKTGKVTSKRTSFLRLKTVSLQETLDMFMMH